MTVVEKITPKAANETANSSPAEQRVVFHDISWQGYETILEVLGDKRSSRLIYYQGTLEIMMPLETHEAATRMIERFISNLVFGLGMKIKTMGSTTLKFPELATSSEPDDCYYIQNQPLVAGKKVDLKVDPPPDLIVEVDITYTNVDKFKVYSTMGIAEFWRYNGEVLKIYQLQDGQYVEVEKSPTFPTWVEKTKLYEFLKECETDETEAQRNLQAWIREKVTG